MNFVSLSVYLQLLIQTKKNTNFPTVNWPPCQIVSGRLGCNCGFDGVFPLNIFSIAVQKLAVSEFYQLLVFQYSVEDNISINLI